MTSTQPACLPRAEIDLLLREHRDQLIAFCAGFQADPHDRDELAQLVMIRVWRGLDRFEHRCAFSTWLFEIVRRTAATEYARRARRPLPVDVVDEAPTSSMSPEDTAVASDSVARALATLDERFRRAVELVDVWGCDRAEAARLCGVGEATLRTRLWRGRRGLRGDGGPNGTNPPISR